MSLLDYDPDTGLFTWKVKRNGSRGVGQIAGTITLFGYRSIMIDGRYYRASRLAFFIVHGRWPHPTVDHINGDRLDNRIDNLREATHAVNSRNRETHREGHLIGTTRCPYSSKNPWAAQIRIDGTTKYLGIFPTQEDAHMVYMRALKAVTRADRSESGDDETTD